MVTTARWLLSCFMVLEGLYCLLFQVALVVKNPPANTGDKRNVSSISGLERSLGGGHGNPRQYSCLENSMDRGVWRTIVHRVPKSLTRLKRLSMHTHTLMSGACWPPWWRCSVNSGGLVPSGQSETFQSENQNLGSSNEWMGMGSRGEWLKFVCLKFLIWKLSGGLDWWVSTFTAF